MPAVSPKQQRLMAQAYALKTGKKKKSDINPEYREEISKVAKSMTKKQLRDFAKTKHSDMKEGILNFYSFNEGHKEINHKNQNLSKDVKKQDHVSPKKPNNSNLSSEEHLAETPKKGTYREPNSKKMGGEEFLAKDHKLTHVKEFNSFNENKNLLTNDEKNWLLGCVNSCKELREFKPVEMEFMKSIFSKLGIGTQEVTSDDSWELGSGY